jgi:hypothetical protein
MDQPGTIARRRSRACSPGGVHTSLHLRPVARAYHH